MDLFRGWNEDKNPEDKNGRTPLHMAAYNQNGAIYEFITELAEKKFRRSLRKNFIKTMKRSKSGKRKSNNNQS